MADPMGILFDPPIAIRPRDAPALTFASVDEATAWIEAERSAWDGWSTSQLGTAAKAWRHDVVQPLAKVLDDLSKIPATADAEARRDDAARLLRGLCDKFEQGPLIASGSPAGQRLLRMIKNGEHYPAAAFAAIVVNKVPLDITLRAKGGVEVPMNASGLFSLLLEAAPAGVLPPDARDAYAAAHTKITEDASRQIADISAQSRALSQMAASVAIDHDTWINKRQEKALRLLKIVSAAIQQGRTERNALKAEYDTLMGLKAPSQYWSKRRTHHAWQAGISLAAFSGLSGLAAYLVWDHRLAIKDLLTFAEGRMDLAAIVALAPIVLVVLWLFRMIVRLFNTSMAEAIDAGQRAVMVQAYLALTRQAGTSVNDAERIIILNALFRSSSGKEDAEGGPASIVDAVVKELAKGKAS